MISHDSVPLTLTGCDQVDDYKDISSFDDDADFSSAMNDDIHVEESESASQVHLKYRQIGADVIVYIFRHWAYSFAWRRQRDKLTLDSESYFRAILRRYWLPKTVAKPLIIPYILCENLPFQIQITQQVLNKSGSNLHCMYGSIPPVTIPPGNPGNRLKQSCPGGTEVGKIKN